MFPISGSIAGSAAPPDPGPGVSNSLRIRSSYLTRLYTGNRKTWSFSCWVKRTKLGVVQDLITSSNGTGATGGYTALWFDASDRLDLVSIDGTGAVVARFTSSAVFRDTNAWYHVVGVFDTTNATAADRLRLYVSSARLTVSAAATNPALDYDGYMGINTYTQTLMAMNYTGYVHLSDAYINRVVFIDGAVREPLAFGRVSPTTGSWESLPAETLLAEVESSGGSSFFLEFNDVSTLAALGTDSSSFDNDLTPTGFSITAGTTYDPTTDAPNLNWAILNPTDAGPALTVSNGGLSVSATATQGKCRATIGMLTGKWYWEHVATSNFNQFGISVPGMPANTYVGQDNYSYGYSAQNGQKYVAAVGTAFGATYTTGDVISVAFDADTGRLWFAKNGVWQASGDPSAGLNPAYTVNLLYTEPYMPSVSGAGAGASSSTINFGQQAFAYTPPTDFLPLNTANLAQAIVKPSDHFRIMLDDGPSIRAACEAVFPNGYLEWIKNRAAVNNHQIIDTVRGSGSVYGTNSAAALTYTAPGVGNPCVGFVFKGSDSAPAANNDGSRTTTLSVNQDAGISFGTYPSVNTNYTLGHGLGKKPSWCVFKEPAGNWFTSHKGLNSMAAWYAQLNSTAAPVSSASVWQNTEPTSSLVYVGPGTNGAVTMAWFFAQIHGFSRFGWYTGNGNANGPFVYCGFRPAFVLIKRTSAAGNWVLINDAPEPLNPSTLFLVPNLTNAEANTASIDLVANGFKIRDTDATRNVNGSSYIYCAFARHPFMNGLAR